MPSVDVYTPLVKILSFVSIPNIPSYTNLMRDGGLGPASHSSATKRCARTTKLSNDNQSHKETKDQHYKFYI